MANTPASQLFITYEAFLEIMAQRILERDPDEEINRAFDLFTAGTQPGRGGEVKIGVDDLRRVARELGEVLEEQELRAMIEEFDIDNDGMSKFTLVGGICFLGKKKTTNHISGEIVSREEFMAICKGE